MINAVGIVFLHIKFTYTCEPVKLKMVQKYNMARVLLWARMEKLSSFQQGGNRDEGAQFTGSEPRPPLGFGDSVSFLTVNKVRVEKNESPPLKVLVQMHICDYWSLPTSCQFAKINLRWNLELNRRVEAKAMSGNTYQKIFINVLDKDPLA